MAEDPNSESPGEIPDSQAENAGSRPKHQHIPTPEELDHDLPQIDVTSLIGLGGMGAVYSGVQKMLNRKVAIKLLPGSQFLDPSFAERFNREARAMARLTHPNIVRIFDVGQTGSGNLYFLMEFIDGEALDVVLRKRELECRETLRIVMEACAALQFAHESGYRQIQGSVQSSGIPWRFDRSVGIGSGSLERPTGEQSEINGRRSSQHRGVSWKTRPRRNGWGRHETHG